MARRVQGDLWLSEHRPCPASPLLEPPDALDVDDVPDLADRADDVLELVEVGDLDHEVVDTPTVVGHRDLGLGDVAVARRNRPGDLGQEPRAVPADVDGDLHGPLGGLRDVPLDVDEPLPVEDALGDGQAVARVDREPAPPGDEAHDLVAGERVAAPGEADEQVVHAADADALVGLRAWRCGRRLGALRRLDEGAGYDLVQELVHGALAIAERRQQVVPGRVAEVGRRLLDLLAAEQRRRVEPVLLGLALEELAAQLDRARALLDLEPLVDLRSGACGLDDLEPVAARMLARRSDNLDDVALAERVAQRHELAIHLRADAVFPDLRVDGVGEVDRRGALGERLHVALGREDVHLVGKQVHAHGVHELAWILHVLLRLDELPQPEERLVELVLARLLLLVEPVRRDALLGDPVHLARANLDLDRVPLGPDDRRVKRLVHVHLRHRDEVLEAAGHRLPQRVDDAEGAVAVAHGHRDDTDRGEVIDLVELPALIVHLLPDRVEVLWPATDLRLDPDLRQLPLEDRDHLVDVRLALEATLGHALLEVDVVLRVEA